MSGQFQNKTEAQKRREAIFTIPAGERESNSVNCEGRSLIAANILQNIESEFVEILGSDDDQLFFPISSRYKEVLDLPVLDTPWDISNLYFPNSYNVSDQDIFPSDVCFSPDGTLMFVTGADTDSVHAYTLPVPWDVSTASYKNSYNVFDQEEAPRGIFIKPDGSTMFIIGFVNKSVHAYTLTKSWDVTSAVYKKSFDVSAQEGAPEGVFFKPDGTSMYVVGYVSDTVHAYTLTKSWDIATATYKNGFDVSAQDSTPENVFFKPDGTTMFVLGSASKTIYSYTLSTPWDVSTATSNNSYDVSAQEGNPDGMFFKPDGTKLFIVGSVSDAVQAYTLSTIWDVSSAVYNNSYNVSAQAPSPHDVFFNPNGASMYILGPASDSVFSYTLSTPWDVSTAVYNNSFSVAVQETTARGMFFKPDGTSMYIIGPGSDSVHAYTLSTPWDVSTATYKNSFNVSSQENNSRGVFFRPDGTSMYVIGKGAGHSVYAYSLSVPWDVSTAAYRNSYDISNIAFGGAGVIIRPDGSSMFIVNVDSVHAFTLSTPWDVSTATYNRSFDVSDQESGATGFFFKPGGSVMYLVGLVSDAVHSYKLNRSAWVSIDIPEITAPYEFLKARTSQVETGERTIKAILRQEA